MAQDNDFKGEEPGNTSEPEVKTEYTEPDAPSISSVSEHGLILMQIFTFRVGIIFILIPCTNRHLFFRNVNP